MKKSTLIRSTFVLSGLLPLLMMSTASADILFVFAPTASGGVKVTGTGSGLVDRLLGITTSDWDVQDFQTNFLAASAGIAIIHADTASGTFSNVTTGVTENITDFTVDADGGSASDNDLDWATTVNSGGNLSFSFEDAFSLQLSATFLPTTLAFNQLIQGTHIDVGHTQGAGIADESFGITTVRVVVPEPATLSLMLGCFASWGIRGWRKR